LVPCPYVKAIDEAKEAGVPFLGQIEILKFKTKHRGTLK